MPPRQHLPDLEAQQDEELMYRNPAVNQEELESRFSDRPVNHAKTLPFHELFTTLFNPLNENRKSRPKQGPRSNKRVAPHEQRRIIIQRFISRWRQQVGNDFYPALRLILPERDRERAMYGLKEKAIAKLLVKVLQISPDSDDGQILLNWKVPGKTTASRMAGDFPGRCYEVLTKRPGKYELGNMRIAEVNERLDRLSLISKEAEQMPIFREFYLKMNPEEMTWLIRVVLRQMKIGASEKTVLDIWHPDGESLFNVSSSLQRVCWELTDPSIRAPDKDMSVTLMESFQPEYAQHPMQTTFQKMIDKLGCTPDDDSFFIEDKLDGERMQMHMQEVVDESKYPGGRRFGFWSRKGKDYTYLYGYSFGDDNSSLTRFIKDAFDPRVKDIILDGEMITWDPESDKMVGFGSLKSAAIAEQNNPFGQIGNRPLFRVFDCLYLNGKDFTKYSLRERRKALHRVLKNVDRRIEIHEYQEAKTQEDIETRLREVVAEAWEGLVLKNPRSMYLLNSRTDDWIKVKPEYMSEFGESLDCVVIGGYWGSGKRGGRLSSFLCGLRVNKDLIDKGANPMKCLSFFKVGGGFKLDDYKKIAYLTEGKWMDWDSKKPPTEYIQLGGADEQKERPDQWIKPCDSVVLQVKAASAGATSEFATRITLRFPRFQRLREDKKWEDSLDINDFFTLKEEAEDSKDKKFKLEASRKRAKRQKQELVIAGSNTVVTPYAGPKTKVFEGLNFCVRSEMVHPKKKKKAEIEQIITSNGGRIFQSPNAEGGNLLCIGDKNVVPVASLVKEGKTNIIRPSWILDTLKQAEVDGPLRSNFLLPFEPAHLFHCLEEQREGIESNVDIYKDSYARDITPEDLKRLTDDMIHPKNSEFDPTQFLVELEERGKGLGDMPGEMLRRCVVRFVGARADDTSPGINLFLAKNRVIFAGGKVAEDNDDPRITHVVFLGGNTTVIRNLRQKFAGRGGKVPRIVEMKWLEDSWSEKTLLDEERYPVSA